MLKDLEDELLDVILVFETIRGILTKLLRNYDWYRLADADSIGKNDDRPDCVSEALLEKEEDIILYQRKIQTLHEKLKGTINLVRRTARISHLESLLTESSCQIYWILATGLL